MSFSARISERLTAGLKRFQPIISIAKSRDINESDTSRIVVDLLCDLFGYDKYSEITSEHAIRGTYCDLAIKLDAKLALLIEVKAIGSDLKEAHIKQAVDYAANQGTEWVILTNAAIWKVFRVIFGKPIAQELVLDLDLTQLGHRNAQHLESLYLLCREAIAKESLLAYHTQRQALNRFTLAAVITSEPIMAAIRRELRRMSPGVRIEDAEIESSLLMEVLKREVVEGEKADEARKKVQKLIAKMKKAAAAAGESKDSPSEQESDGAGNS